MAYTDIIHKNCRMIKEDGEIVNIAEMIVKDGFHTTSTELNAIAEGNSFVTGNIFITVAAEAYAVLHIKTGANISVLSYSITGDGLIYYGAYKNPTITTNGTTIAASSRNMVTVKAALTQAFHTPTYSAIGTPIVLRTNGAGTGPSKGASGGGDSRTLVLPPNTSILIVAQNKSTTAQTIGIVADWIEVI